MCKAVFIQLLAASCLAWGAPAWANSGSTMPEEWQTFDIGAQESLNFDQPTMDSIEAIRILGDAPTLIEGSLTSNGSLFLINTNGFTLTSGADVTVRSLYLSTDSSAYDWFLTRQWPDGSSLDGGSITLAGTINANTVGVWAGGNVFMSSGGRVNFSDEFFANSNGGIFIDQGFVATYVPMPVPEPESWMLLLAGLGLIGAAHRCRIHFS